NNSGSFIKDHIGSRPYKFGGEDPFLKLVGRGAESSGNGFIQGHYVGDHLLHVSGQPGVSFDYQNPEHYRLLQDFARQDPTDYNPEFATAQWLQDNSPVNIAHMTNIGTPDETMVHGGFYSNGTHYGPVNPFEI